MLQLPAARSSDPLCGERSVKWVVPINERSYPAVTFAAVSLVSRSDRQTVRQTDRDCMLLCLNPENKAVFNNLCNIIVLCICWIVIFSFIT